VKTAVHKILIIEDDIVFSKIISNFLVKANFEVNVESGWKSGIENYINNQPDLVILDYRLQVGNGFDFINAYKAFNKKAPIIMMTSYHEINIAVKAMKMGVVDFITKPIQQDELLLIINQCLKKTSTTPLTNKPNQSTNTQPENNSNPIKFVKGNTPKTKVLYEHIQLVSKTDYSVIISGESGTGKEHLAKIIHNNSSRSNQPFIAIDCGALSNELAGSELFGHIKGAFTGAIFDKKGCFERANNGTIFLDEIGNLSYEIQVMLLRAIQENTITPIGGIQPIPINVRIITATNEQFDAMIDQGQFRLDLFHRLNEFQIKVPALRDRIEDLQLFIDYFINEVNIELNKRVENVNSDVLNLMQQYEWPGNIRELKNIIRRGVLLSTTNLIEPKDLPNDMFKQKTNNNIIDTIDLKLTHEQIEKDHIIRALEATKYNKTKAAQLLNIDRTTLYNKMHKYKL
jgi:two-component system response regulator HydG